MPDVSLPPDDPTTSQRIGAKVDMLIEQGHALYATALTGTPTGRTRRKTLYTLAMVGTVIGLALDGAVGIIAGLVALIAMLLLAMTDDIVDLSQ